MIEEVIEDICLIRPFQSTEIAYILGKREDYIKRRFLAKMITSKKLRYLHPEMIHHPEQAYITNKNN